MLTNSLMNIQLAKLTSDDFVDLELPEKLNEIIGLGFLEEQGSFLSKRLMDYCTSVQRSSFDDEIAYECFVNSFHMEDYVDRSHLAYSIVFSNELIRKWKLFRSSALNVIIALDDETFLPKIKFHAKRDGAEWLMENELESYIQPILITTEEIHI
ncbi:Uncharacterised protein [Yersinia intermedia]|nr:MULTISPECIES: hypothetical protein [Enterobacterales]HDX8417261.1 hypothetical protein [Yersinia enterocolitica]CNB70017.1 Uncharacterised protein [Yersinia intermedia]CNC20153.1 Uncharacterised protein [Yersinia intermedia]CNH19154.1 Uncharacterised protein [Yersinia intermedia]CRE87044.1 Uncharacterised protein [Yersinia intermedia]